MSDKPKPCPWCGWHGDRIGVYPGNTFRWMVPSCIACGATPGDVRVKEYVKYGTPLSDSPANYAAALEMWNTRASPWQPIETAPKDGTEVWAFNGEQGRMKWIEGSEYALWVHADELLSDVDPSPEQPTHYTPLREPPKD